MNREKLQELCIEQDMAVGNIFQNDRHYLNHVKIIFYVKESSMIIAIE